GAMAFDFGTASLLAIGCVMARQCHLNTCPVGIATQDEKLRLRFNGKPEMVIAYFRALAEEVRKKMASLGVRSLGELRGWYDRLGTRSGMDAFLGGRIPQGRHVAPQQPARDRIACIEDARLFSNALEPVQEAQPIQNSDRSIGAGLSGELMRRRAQGRNQDYQITQE